MTKNIEKEKLSDSKRSLSPSRKQQYSRSPKRSSVSPSSYLSNGRKTSISPFPYRKPKIVKSISTGILCYL